jgi:hypothetical protein
MEENIAEKVKRSIKEDSMNVRRKIKNHLIIYDLTTEEYDRFINFLKTEVPTRQGYTGLGMLLDAYEKFKYSDKLIEKLEAENAELKSKEAEEEKPKKKWIGSE